MSDGGSEESWASFLARCAADLPELGADELDDELLVDPNTDDCIEQIDGQESMQGPSEEDGSRPRALDPQGSGQDPGGTPQGGENAPIADVGDPRGSQDTVMTDAATESGAVITPEGARADREPLVPIPPQRTPIPPMQGEQLTSEQASQRSIQQAMAMQRAMAIEPIWRAAPGGAENMARRTAIVVGPAVGQYTTRVAADAAREANWRARGLAPLGITDEELTDIRGLRDATIEFAALTSRNNYIPLGYTIDDLLRFYVARRPAVLEQDNLHIRMLAGEILTIKPKQTKQTEVIEQIQDQLDTAKAKLQRLEEQVDTWKAQEPLAGWYEEEQPELPDAAAMDADPPVAEQPAVLPPVPPQVPIVQQQQQIVPADVQAASEKWCLPNQQYRISRCY